MEECVVCGVYRFMATREPRWYHPYVCSDDCGDKLHEMENAEMGSSPDPLAGEEAFPNPDEGRRQRWSFGYESPEPD